MRQERQGINSSARKVVDAMNQEGPAFVDASITKPGGVVQAGPQNVSPGRLADVYPVYRGDVAKDEGQTQQHGR